MQKEVRFEDSVLAQFYPGGFKQMDREDRLWTRSRKWAREHTDELARDYPDSVIAIHRSRVVATAPTMGDLVRLLDICELPRGEIVFRSTLVEAGYMIL